ncbi:mitochondrial import receptor subunit TOM70 [Mycetomoellerius zeteki]|nr:PREDICTED: mitochondrial import receptor subunit TOM70-like [Trachymyrmex zeteki]
MGKYNDAIAQYNKAIETCPKENIENLAVFYENRAAAYEQLKIYSAVKADCTKALEQNPKYTKALLRRARVLEQIGDLEAALKDMTTVCIHENFSDQSSLLKADNILEKLVNQHARENLANKKAVMPNEHFIKLYIVAFPKDPVFSRLKCPENIPEFFKKPLQALKDKKYDEVIPLCTEIIESPEFDTLPSTKLEVVLLRATFYTFLNENNSAIHDFESILNTEYASDDVKINALLKRADLHKGLKNKEMVFKDFDLAISINPACSDIYYHRGLTYVYMHLLTKAKPDFEKAIVYNPNFSMAYIQKSYTDYQIGILNKDKKLVRTAVKAFEAIFIKYPTVPECIYCYVLFRGMMSEIRQYRKAHIYFIKITKRHPYDPSMSFVYLQRAFLQFDWDNDFDKAMKYLYKSIKLNEKCDAAYKALGTIEIERGNIQKAIRLLDKALIYCRTSKELLNIYHLRDATKVQLDIKNQAGLRYIPQFLLPFSFRFLHL